MLQRVYSNASVVLSVCLSLHAYMKMSYFDLVDTTQTTHESLVNFALILTMNIILSDNRQMWKLPCEPSKRLDMQFFSRSSSMTS